MRGFIAPNPVKHQLELFDMLYFLDVLLGLLKDLLGCEGCWLGHISCFSLEPVKNFFTWDMNGLILLSLGLVLRIYEVLVTIWCIQVVFDLHSEGLTLGISRHILKESGPETILQRFKSLMPRLLHSIFPKVFEDESPLFNLWPH